MSVVLGIVLDGNSRNVCYAGKVTKGHIIVKNSEKIKMRGIHLEVRGEGHFVWSYVSGTGHIKAYNGDECYLNSVIDVVGSRSRNSEMYLEPGSHKLPFQFEFPGHLPSSYEDKTGKINYKMKAVIDRPWKCDDTAEILLTVFRLLDLNKEPPSLWEPVVIEREEEARGTGCFCCCVYGVVNIKATISRGCFVATEKILISGEIVNKSKYSVRQTKISFIQNAEYHVITSRGTIYHTKHERRVLEEVTRPQISQGWSGIGFVVPCLPASRMDGCKFIDISYGIEITASVDAGEATIFIPIVIGDTALHSNFQPHAVTSQPLYQNPPMKSYQSTYGYPLPEDSCTKATSNPHVSSSTQPAIHKIKKLADGIKI